MLEKERSKNSRARIYVNFFDEKCLEKSLGSFRCTRLSLPETNMRGGKKWNTDLP